MLLGPADRDIKTAKGVMEHLRRGPFSVAKQPVKVPLSAVGVPDSSTSRATRKAHGTGPIKAAIVDQEENPPVLLVRADAGVLTSLCQVRAQKKACRCQDACEMQGYLVEVALVVSLRANFGCLVITWCMLLLDDDYVIKRSSKAD
jgi:hypothetical protein